MEGTNGLRIAIVGGGVCGLTCAVALAKRGIQAHVFEAAPQFGEIGAGVGIGPNAVRVLQDIGILHEFYAGADGHEFIYGYPVRPEDVGLGLHRARFLDALMKNIDSKYTHHNKRCKSILQTDLSSPAVIHFEDGTTFEADVVLGADGIKSAVRGSVIEVEKNPVVFSNTTCYRGLIPIEDIESAGVLMNLTQQPTCFVGFDKHIILFPISSATIINVVAFGMDRSIPIGEANRPDNEPWVVPASREQLLKEYEGWGSDVLKILGCIKNPTKWMIHVVHPPLKTYVNGRIALLGDSAHAMLPHLGAGAGQALEDAHLLAQLLGDPQTNVENIPVVLEAYDRVRRPRAQMVWEGSRIAGDTYEGHGKHGNTVQGLREDLHDLLEPVWRHELSADLRDALGYLYETAAFRDTVSS
ncbi:hypothetical protein EUX98_g790 [Antrodiella citrinella]|uniref:FAD-binding domain-containing protein n=1 Tax=Antrodiella citrinella TaxID=2447956 RepID=A0A4S4N364_9APHY|nr:hypothetical protein EUX98_g790 [Antrodiella citrinella]